MNKECLKCAKVPKLPKIGPTKIFYNFLYNKIALDSRFCGNDRSLFPLRQRLPKGEDKSGEDC